MAICMFIFICWWFPRAWSRGNAIQNASYDEQRIQRQQAAQRVLDEEASVELADDVGKKANVSVKPQMPRGYVPPVTAY